MDVIERLKNAADSDYKKFSQKLIPEAGKILGCKTPYIKSVAKEMSDEEKIKFMARLPHEFHEENMCHAFCIAYVKKDTQTKLDMVDSFLPFVDNWAVCDSMVCALWKKDDSEKVYAHALRCLKSDKPFTVRYGAVCLLNKFLPDRFSDFIDHILQIDVDDYYVDMAIAWLMSESLVKCYDLAVKYFEKPTFKKFIHNKSIQKAVESYRIGNDEKAYLKGLKIK